MSKTFNWQSDLRRIRKWIRERDPVLIGVADGADALLDAGYKPHVVVGTLDELSARALHSGALVVVTATSTHDKGGAERFEKAKVDPIWFIATGSALAFSKRSAPPLSWVDVAVTTTSAPEWNARAASSSSVPTTT